MQRAEWALESSRPNTKIFLMTPTLPPSCKRQPEVLELQCPQVHLKLFMTPSKHISDSLFHLLVLEFWCPKQKQFVGTFWPTMLRATLQPSWNQEVQGPFHDARPNCALVTLESLGNRLPDFAKTDWEITTINLFALLLTPVLFWFFSTLAFLPYCHPHLFFLLHPLVPSCSNLATYCLHNCSCTSE